MRKSCRLWRNVEKYCRARQTRNDNAMRRRKDAICMPGNLGKNTDTHSEYLIFIAS